MEMKDSGVDIIGKIPQKWEIKRLKYLVSITTGSQDTQDASDDGVYPFYVRSPKVERINKYVFDGEAILMAGDGVGAGKVFHYVNGKFGCHQRVYIIHSFKNVKPLFLFQYIRSLFSVGIEKGSAKSTVDSIRLPMLHNFFVVLPSLPEQQLIADFLDVETKKIDDILNDLRLQIDILRRYKKSLISETVTKGLNPDMRMKDSGIDWIGKIPEEWKINKLGYLGQLQNGISKEAGYFGSGFPFVSYGDVYNNISLPKKVYGLVESTKEEQRRYSVQKGDAFFTRTSETIEEIGFASVCSQTINEATFAGFLIRFRPTDMSLSMAFAKYYFRSEFLRAYFVKEMMIVTRASLGQYLLKNLPVLLPYYDEQEKIAAFLDKKCAQIDVLLQDKQTQIDKLESYRKSLIYEYVTGKKRVKGVQYA